MPRQIVLNRLFLKALIVCVFAVGTLGPVHSAMLGTAEIANPSPELSAELMLEQRAQLHQQLTEYGVEAAVAVNRVGQLTDQEVVMLSTSLDESPAGGGFLTIAAVVFLTLLATDILGYTDIFPFVKKGANGSQGPVVTEN